MKWGIRDEAGAYSKMAIPSCPASMRSFEFPVLLCSYDPALVMLLLGTGSWVLLPMCRQLLPHQPNSHVINVCSYSGNIVHVHC